MIKINRGIQIKSWNIGIKLFIGREYNENYAINTVAKYWGISGTLSLRKEVQK